MAFVAVGRAADDAVQGPVERGSVQLVTTQATFEKNNVPLTAVADFVKALQSKVVTLVGQPSVEFTLPMTVMLTKDAAPVCMVSSNGNVSVETQEAISEGLKSSVPDLRSAEEALIFKIEFKVKPPGAAAATPTPVDLASPAQ